jgi:hypothetical protein
MPVMRERATPGSPMSSLVKQGIPQGTLSFYLLLENLAMSTFLKSLTVCLFTGILAAAALAQNSGDSDQITTILKLLKHENPRVRSAAAFTLGSMGKKAAPALENLILAAGDDSKDVQQAVMEAIAKITSGSTIPTGNGSATATGQENKTGNGTYHVPNLAVNPQGMEKLMDHHKVWLNAGTKVTIQVKSEVNGDVDCYLDDPSGKELAKDISLSKDCFVQAEIMQSGYHTIVLDNLGNSVNKCNVTYSSTAK